MGFLAGYGGSIEIPTNTTWALSEWTLEFSNALLDVTSFSASGYRVRLAGLMSARITARGPYNSGSMALAAGNSYAFTLKASGSVSWLVTAYVSSISITTPVDGPVQVQVTAESTGSFTAAIT